MNAEGQFQVKLKPLESFASGSVAGKAGTFVLQHSGLMDRGRKNLTLLVVPDSATGALAGLSGTMEIDIRDGQHFYAFEYRLP